MNITKESRITGIVDHEVEYQIEDAYWNELIASGLDEEEALNKARSDGKALFLNAETSLVEVSMEHESIVNAS